MKAIETTATWDAEKGLVLDTDLSAFKDQHLRVIILIPESEKDIDEAEWLEAGTNNQAFDFLKDEEDVYTHSDGKPFNGQR